MFGYHCCMAVYIMTFTSLPGHSFHSISFRKQGLLFGVFLKRTCFPVCFSQMKTALFPIMKVVYALCCLCENSSDCLKSRSSEHLVCARPCSQCFMSLNSLNLLRGAVAPFYTWAHSGVQRPSHTPGLLASKVEAPGWFEPGSQSGFRVCS